jgi:hypothetical protein
MATTPAPQPKPPQLKPSLLKPAQLKPWVRGRRSFAGWMWLTVGLVIAAPIALALGCVIVAVAVAAWVARSVIWLIVAGWAWIWYFATLIRREPYPFVVRPPRSKRQRGVVLNDAFLSSLPRTVGLVARIAVFIFAPIVLLASLVGIVSSAWRARPYVAVFSLPALERKLVGLGRLRGFFDDGQVPNVVEYDQFVAALFPQRADFVRWWHDQDAPRRFEPAEAEWRHPTEFSGLTLGPYPDVLGFPGLAMAAMRRSSIDGLRELFISQREIDDMGDPDLDDRAECAVIRVVSRVGVDDVRRWIVQLPSTQTWHPTAGQAPNDITADFVALSLRETTMTRAALEAMRIAGIGPDEPVLAAGFSLGGMVAAQIAEVAPDNGFRVTHVVTAGSSVGRDRIDPGIRVLSIEHILDSVPRIDGRENPVRGDAAPGSPEWVTVKAGPPLPRGYDVSSTHHSPSYAETAGAIQGDPPDERVRRFLDQEFLEFFGRNQQLTDFAATRAGRTDPQPAVPFYLHSTVERGITRGTLRTTLRRVPGVIAVDIYQSRTGFPTTILWNADVLVRSLRPWFHDVERAAVYRGLLSLLKRRRAIGIGLRLQAKESPGVTWTAVVQRMQDGRWRESVDVSFATAESEAEFLPVLLPGGWASRITYYPADAFA